MAQWIEHQPMNRKVTGLIPNQCTCLGLRPGPWWGACGRQPTDVSLACCCFSPSLSPSSPLSQSKINKIFKKKKESKWGEREPNILSTFNHQNLWSLLFNPHNNSASNCLHFTDVETEAHLSNLFRVT